jgi:hypothetical protein
VARSDPRLVLIAQLTGVCAGYALAKRCSRDEALAEIRTLLAGAKPFRPGLPAVLDEALSRYLTPTGPGDAYWYPAAVDLLVEAGADLERARAIEVGRRAERVPCCA